MKNNNNKKFNIKKNQDTNVIVNFPNEINIDLVQSNELKHYELFQWLVALLLSIAIGFWTAYCTLIDKDQSLFWSAIVFTVLSVLFIILAFYYRKKVYQGSIKKEISLGDFKNR